MTKRKARTRKTPGKTASGRRSTTPRRRRIAETTPARRAPRGDSGLAPGMHAINSHLAVANVGASMAFLEQAFGFTRGVVLPDADGQLRYAEMRHGDSVVILVRRGDVSGATGGSAALYTYVADVDRALAQARQAGAGVEEAEDKPWGDRVAVVIDPDGYRWALATFKKLAPFE
jgi:uncharacterized glyoxalase superfamily protein PhnB